MTDIFWLTSKCCSWFIKAGQTFYQMDLIRLDVQFVQKIPSEMVNGQQMKVKKNDQNYSCFYF